MRRLFTALAALTLTITAFGQAQITTRKEKLSDFTTRTMKVVLSGNHFIDPVIREAVNNTWSLSAFEFCSLEDFNSLKNNEEYYFMLPVKVKYRPESKPGIMMLTIVKGRATAKTVNDMVNVVSVPVAAADIPSGREAAMIPGLVDIMQGYIAKSLNGNFAGLRTYVTPLGKSSGRRVVIAREDLSETIDSTFCRKMARKGLDIVDGEVADSLFLSGDSRTLVSYVVAPAEPEKGSVCWRILIDARTHELFYYRKRTLKKEDEAGFHKGDLKIIAKTR